MADVSSEASLRFTSTGADKAAADARKLEDSLKSVERQAQRTAASLKSPLGIPATGGRVAGGRRAAAGSLKAPPSGDKLSGALGIKLAEAVIDAFGKRATVLAAAAGKQQEAAARASLTQAEATTKAVEAEAKATTKAAEAGLKASGKAGEAKAKSTVKTAEAETKATTKAGEAKAKSTIRTAEAETKATSKSADAQLKATVRAAEAQARAAAKAADAEAKAGIKANKAAQARVATTIKAGAQILAPITGLIPPAITAIAAAGSGLGLLGIAAAAVAAPVTLLVKSFKWISDAAEAASENFLKAQDNMRGGPDVAAEQERLQRAQTALNVTIGASAGQFIDEFNKLARGLRAETFSDAAQKQLDKFGITRDKLKEFEDKTGNIDPSKGLRKFVETQDRIRAAIAAAEKTGDPKAIEEAKKTWDEWGKVLEQIGPVFNRGVKGATQQLLDAGEEHRRKMEAVLPLKPRDEVAADTGKFDFAINRMKDTWNRLFQVVGEGAMPAATAAISKWADVLTAIAPKLAEVGKSLTTEAWSGVAGLAQYLKETIESFDDRKAIDDLKAGWLAFWSTVKAVGAELRSMVGTFNDVKEAVKGFYPEWKAFWETTKQEFEGIRNLIGIIGNLGENTKREWETIKRLMTEGWAAFEAGWDSFSAAVRTGFQNLKDFIFGLAKVPTILKPGQLPPSMMPGAQPSSYGGDGSDISLDNARIQLANFGTGTAGAEMRGGIDRALIHVSGTMQAIIQNASIIGRTGLDTGPGTGVQNATWGAPGTGGFGSGGTGASSSGRIAGVGSHDFGGASLGGTAPGGKQGESFAQHAPGLMKRLMDEKGLTRQQAAGVVGNLGHESAGFTAFEEGAANRYGTRGAGWAQWTDTPGSPRRTMFETWAKSHGMNPKSPDASEEYLLNGDPQFAKAIADVKRATTREEAVSVFEKSFERSAHPNAPGRFSWAARAEQLSSGGGEAPTGGQPAAAAGGDLRGGGADRGAHRGGAYTAEEVARNRPATEAVAERLRAAGIGINSTYRSESHDLSKANPSSMHVRGRAIDLKARTPAEGAANLAKAREALSAQGFKEGVDYNVLDETGSRRSAHATGSHLHLSMTRAGIAKQRGEQPGGGDGGGDGGGESIKTGAATPSAPAPAASAAQPALGPAQALALAQQNLGANEITDRSKLASFFKSAGYDIDPKTIAWCSTYTAASLKRAGIEPPQNAAVASSFLNWGQGVDPNQGIQAGDVVVQKRHRDTGGMLKPGQPGGHVGLATGKTRVNPKTGRLEIESIEGNTLNAQGRGGFVAPQWEEASEHSVRRAPPRPDGGPITRPDVAGNQPIIVPPRAAGIDKSTVAAQGPAADGAAARTFKSASEGAAFGQSAAESIRKGLEGTNIPVSGVPSTSRGVSPNTGPKSTGGDAPTTDI